MQWLTCSSASLNRSLDPNAAEVLDVVDSVLAQLFFVLLGHLLARLLQDREAISENGEQKPGRRDPALRTDRREWTIENRWQRLDNIGQRTNESIMDGF